MSIKTTDERNRLQNVASEICSELRGKDYGNPLRLRVKVPEIVETQTAGWAAQIGRINGRKIALEIWLDQYSGHESSIFSACFYSFDHRSIADLVPLAPEGLRVTSIGTEHYYRRDDGNFVLKQKLAPRQLDQLFEEHYPEESSHFLSLYGSHSRTSAGSDYEFIERAVGFFSDVIRTLCESEFLDQSNYPKEENRKLVRGHLARERNSFLAAKCKKRDGYKCQICGMTFLNHYGSLGAHFAEAHHIRPLSNMGDRVRTRLEDLITVCSNCHRMLHRMKGEQGDIEKLRNIFYRQIKSNQHES